MRSDGDPDVDDRVQAHLIEDRSKEIRHRRPSVASPPVRSDSGAVSRASGAQRDQPRVVGETADDQVAQPGPRRGVAGQLRQPADEDQLVGGQAPPAPVEVELGQREMDARDRPARSRAPRSRRRSTRGTAPPTGRPPRSRRPACAPRRGRRHRWPSSNARLRAIGIGRRRRPRARRRFRRHGLRRVARAVVASGAATRSDLEDAERPLERLRHARVTTALRAFGRPAPAPAGAVPCDSASSSARRATSQASASRPPRSSAPARRSSVVAASAARPSAARRSARPRSAPSSSGAWSSATR